MARLCENDHEVRDGMFVCPACGSDDVADRGPGRTAVHATEGDAGVGRSEHAEQRLTGFVNRGLLLVVLAFLGRLVALALAADGTGLGAGFFALVSWALGLAGAAYLLCGIVGWGVKYGNEATAPQ